MSESKSSGGSAPGAGKGGIPRNVLLGALGAGAAAVIGAVFFLHPKMPTLSSSSTTHSQASSSAGERGTEARSGSERAAEVSGTHAGATRSSGSAGAQRNVAASGHRPAHSAGRSSASRAARIDPDVPSKRVSLRDLDLSTHKGACLALRRIKSAAEQVCPDDERQLDMWHVHQQCLQDSMARAVKDTHSARLQALYVKPKGC